MNPPAARAMLNVGGRSIHYAKLGSGAGAAVLIHGFASDSAVWAFNTLALAQTATVYALDLPGHGHSGVDAGDGSLALLVRVVTDFMDRLQLRKTQLIGHSLGGAIAVKLAAERPDLAAALTLVAPAGISASGTSDPVSIDFIDGFLSMQTTEQATNVLSRLVAKPSLISPDLIASVLRRKQEPGVSRTLEAIVRTAIRKDLRDGALRASLLSLEIPVQLLWGALDTVIPIDRAADLPGSIPMHRIEDAGHLAHMEKAALANRLIAAQSRLLVSN